MVKFSAMGQECEVKIGFHGYNHNQQNLQNVDPIVEMLDIFFTPSSGSNTIFWETVDRTQQEIRDHKANVGRWGSNLCGFVAAMTLEVTGRKPTLSYVDQKIDEVERAGKRKTVDEILPYTHLQDYYLTQTFDQLIQKYDVRLEYESHSQSIARTVKAIMKQSSSSASAAIESWERGDFMAAILNQKRYFELEVVGYIARETEVNITLSDMVKSLLKSRRGGSVFILWGAYHLPVFERLRDRFKREDINWQATTELPVSSPDLKIVESLRKKIIADDTNYAQDLFHKILLNGIYQVLNSRNRFADYVLFYSDIEHSCRDIMLSLELDEIRRMCERKVSAMEVLTSYKSKLCYPIDSLD